MKTKKFLKAMLISALCASSVLSTTACGNKSDALQFWFYGDEEEISVYTAMTEEFNRELFSSTHDQAEEK